MKIFCTEQIQALDKFTIQNESISSIDLMERAAASCCEWISQKFSTKHKFFIFCGGGNNGGDGLAVARLIHQKGYWVQCYLLCFSKKTSADFETNKKKLLSLKIPFQEINSINSSKKVTQMLNKMCKSNSLVFIDAILGSGLNRSISGWLAAWIDKINALKQTTISIDIPSGLFADGKNFANSIQADYTLSFELPKLAFFLPQNEFFLGEWILLPMALSQKFIAQEPVNYYFLNKKEIQPLIKKRAKFSHKGNYGHCVIIAGMLGKMGAAVLCAKASLRTGAGLVTLHLPTCGAIIAQSSLPEAMVELNEGQNFLFGKWNSKNWQGKNTVLALGCGIGLEKQTQDFVYSVITTTTKPMVIDADALNILAKNPSWIAKIPKGSILTPHPKEFQRLVGDYNDDLQKLAKQKEFAMQYQLYLILKGAHTAIATPKGDVFFNSTGNPAMAKGGSGDILTGILVALLAQGYHPQHSCLLGVYLHGLCGDICMQKEAAESVIASDLLTSMGEAWNSVRIE